jgi:hypothetical protein
MLAFLCLMSTELLPVLAHDTGNADAWLIALTLTGFSLVVRERYRAAAAIAAVGPLVHEGFVFLWSPVALLLLSSALASGPAPGVRHRSSGAPEARPDDARRDADHSIDPPRRWREWKIAAAVLPVVTAVAVTRAHSPAAVAQLMDAWPVSDAIKSGHQVYTFGQTLKSSFAHMRDFEFRGNWDNFAIATGFFLVPNLLLIWAAAFCFWRRWSAPLATLLLAVTAMLAPLAVVIVGWDLSRFLCWSTVAAGVALVGVGSPSLVTMSDTGG